MNQVHDESIQEMMQNVRAEAVKLAAKRFADAVKFAQSKELSLAETYQLLNDEIDNINNQLSH